MYKSGLFRLEKIGLRRDMLEVYKSKTDVEKSNKELVFSEFITQKLETLITYAPIRRSRSSSSFQYTPDSNLSK